MIAVAPQSNEGEFKSVAELLVEEVSPSRLKRWLTCRLQFFFHYLAQIKKPSKPALAVGKVVHAVLQEFNRARWRGDFAFRERLDEVFQAKWTEERESVEWEESEKTEQTKALGLIEFYLDQSPIKPDEKPQAVEVRLEAYLGKHGLPKLIGILDLVRPNRVVVDYKTSSQTPQADALLHQNEIQLTSYGLLYRENTGDQEGGFELHHLVKTKTPKLIVTKLPPITDQQQSRLFKQIESYVAGIEREDFVPSPSMACLSCSFINECRAWH